jgi:hypothetical protein
MNEQELNQHMQEGHRNNKGHIHKRPYWKRAHLDWRVWVGIILMLAAIIYYVMSQDFALAPHRQMMQHHENHRTP